jgi:hypothetical protein
MIKIALIAYILTLGLPSLQYGITFAPLFHISVRLSPPPTFRLPHIIIWLLDNGLCQNLYCFACDTPSDYGPTYVNDYRQRGGMNHYGIFLHLQIH